MIAHDTLIHLWLHLGWPLLRLLLFLAVGLLAALFIESLNWTRKMAIVARPLTRFGHLSPLTGASFSLCFFSGIAANTMLAEGYDKKQLSRKELILANLFNSLPANFLHLPTTFFIAVPIIKGAAFIYIGLTISAAIVRTLCITLLGRLLLPAANTEVVQTAYPQDCHLHRTDLHLFLLPRRSRLFHCRRTVHGPASLLAGLALSPGPVHPHLPDGRRIHRRARRRRLAPCQRLHEHTRNRACPADRQYSVIPDPGYTPPVSLLCRHLQTGNSG